MARVWRIILIEVVLSVLIVPLLVTALGIAIHGTALDALNEFGILYFAWFCFSFGILQFGPVFAVAGMVCGLLASLATSRWYDQLLVIAVPMFLVPFAADMAILQGNWGHWPLIQDTTPYFIAGAPAGLILGLSTLFITRRLSAFRQPAVQGTRA